MIKRQALANALLLALGMTLLAVQAAPAATITVTTSNDLLDAAPQLRGPLPWLPCR